ncbi:MAG: DMT family transporter [Anaerolineales bacterium]|nr:DMT family transporter [Anaerolineales bacterium]
MWVVFALGAALLTSLNPILYKRMLKEANTLVVVWGVTLLALPLLGLFAFAFIPQFPKFDWLFMLGVLGSAGLNAVAHLSSTRALKLADVSLVTPLLIFSPVFTVLISALFLGEIPSLRGLLGVGLVLAGAYWLNYRSGADWFTPFKSLALTPAVTLVLLAGFLWAVTPLFEKTAIQHTDPQKPPSRRVHRRRVARRHVNSRSPGARQGIYRKTSPSSPRVFPRWSYRRRRACFGIHRVQPGFRRVCDHAFQTQHADDVALEFSFSQRERIVPTPARFRADGDWCNSSRIVNLIWRFK